MDPTVRSKLERWMRKQILIQDEDKGRCTKLVLRHVASGRLASELDTIRVPKKGLDEGWFNETLVNLENQIMDDAEGLGGTQTYVVLPYFENNADKPGSRFTIREAASGIEDPEDVESEPPTKTGVLTQMMRHTEAATRVSLMSMGQIITTMKQTIARQSETIEKLTADKMANLETMEKLRSEEMERRLLFRREENKEKMYGEVFDKVSTLLPLVVNKLAGKNLLPAKATPTEAMVQGFIESISPEQVESLQHVLKPTQLVLLMEIFQNVQKNEKPETPPSDGAITQHN